jgi:hypothetical protein
MSIIKGMLQEEYERLKSLLAKYQAEVSKLPAGSVSEKQIKGNRYAYIARRRKSKIEFIYIGRASSPKVQSMRDEIKRRKDYESKIRILKEDIKELERALGGRKV